MEKPLVDQLLKKGSLDSEIKKKEKAIKNAWTKALPQIKKLAGQAGRLTGGI